MHRRLPLIRAVLQLALSIALIVGAITGNQVVLLLAAIAVVGLLIWEFEARRRRRSESTGL
jgi:hypothetical protein